MEIQFTLIKVQLKMLLSSQSLSLPYSTISLPFNACMHLLNKY